MQQEDQLGAKMRAKVGSEFVVVEILNRKLQLISI